MTRASWFGEDGAIGAGAIGAPTLPDTVTQPVRHDAGPRHTRRVAAEPRTVPAGRASPPLHVPTPTA